MADDTPQYYNNRRTLNEDRSILRFEKVFVLVIPLIAICGLIVVMLLSASFKLNTNQTREQQSTKWSFKLNESSKLNVRVLSTGVATAGRWLSFGKSGKSRNGFTETIVLMLHGFPLDADKTWRQVAHTLQDEYSVVFPDQRGFRGSLIEPVKLNFNSEMFDLQTLATDVKRYVDKLLALSPTSDILVVGHDFGGLVAYAFAGWHGQTYKNLRGVVAVNAPHPYVWQQIFTGNETQLAKSHSSYLKTLLSDITPQQLWNTMFSDGAKNVAPSLTSMKKKIVAEWTSDSALKIMQNWYKSLFVGAPPTLPIDEWFEAVNLPGIEIPATIPVLAVAGSDDHLLSPTLLSLSHLREAVPNLRTYIVPNGTHWLPLESPAKVAQLIREFLYKTKKEQE